MTKDVFIVLDALFDAFRILFCPFFAVFPSRLSYLFPMIPSDSSKYDSREKCIFFIKSNANITSEPMQALSDGFYILWVSIKIHG